MSLQTIDHIFMVTQRETGRHRTFVGLSSLDFTASWHFPRAQESPPESRICSELPLESAQEPRSNINFALVVAFVSSAYPATDSFPAISLMVLGSSKRAGILGERYLPLVEKHGKDLPRPGREAVSPALQCKQRLFRNICLYVNNLSLSFRIPLHIQSLSPCSHRSLFCLLNQQNMVFAFCQTSPWSSPLSSPWQPLPQPRSCHVRLTVPIMVQSMWPTKRDITVTVTVIFAIV